MRKKIAFDMLLNIVATAVPTVVLQLIILPSLAGNMSDSAYGLLVTIIALLNVVSATMGNVLNNIRLIYGREDELKEKRDYNVILIVLCIINTIVIATISYLYEDGVTFISIILTVVASTLWLLREYFIVAFRIKLNYVHIVITNILLVIGYLAGYYCFKLIGHWQLVYIIGNICSLCFVFVKSSLWKEPVVKSTKIKYLSKETTWLLISCILTRVTTYADKLLIFPVLGGATVSIYYAATVFGKVVSMATSPISSVMLSYLSKGKNDNKKIFKTTVICGAVVCLVGYCICILISRPILTIIYPQYVEEAMKYISLTTTSVVLVAFISVINPFVLKSCEMKWQIAINGSMAFIYVVLSMSLLSFLGLYGFCIGAIISYVVKIIVMLVVYRKFNRDSIVQNQENH